MKEYFSKITSKNITKNISLFLLFLFISAYLSSYCFRSYMEDQKIDSNFIVAFLTAITLMFTIKQSKEERNYQYDLETNKFCKERVEIVIGKLFIIMNQSEIFLNTMKDIKKSIDSKVYFKDANDVDSKSFIENNKEIVGSYITLYFVPYLNDDWNDMEKKLNEISTNCVNLLENYKENYNLIQNNNFKNPVLDNIDKTILESEKLNKEIYTLTEKMKNTLIEIVEKNENVIKGKYFK